MPCRGLHCNGCRDGGGGVLAVVVVLVLIAAIAKPLESAARTAGHVLADVLEVVVISVAVLAAAAAAVALGWAGVRVHRWHSARRTLAPPAVIRAEVIDSSPLPAIEAPRPKLAGMYEEVNDASSHQSARPE
jgi:hypothetical protein